MDEVRIISSDIDGLREEARFAIALQLSRFVNALRANQRHYLRAMDGNDPASIRDQIELVLHHGAIVFEASKTLLEYQEQLSQTEAWSERRETVNVFEAELGDFKSFTHRYLKYIRNKLAFHYDIDELTKTLRAFPLDEHRVFAQAQSDKQIDLAFILVDEILLESLLSRMTEKDTEQANWAYFQETLMDMSRQLASLLQELILDLIGFELALAENGSG